ncbi:tRNA (adenine(58)-N(1))-methyltransferase non-catalytic subunit TRM6, putative [Plasmodium knowlesi strain H]|uniref:tRNA (adenine(58)-N(1))-methyltransferase non-catalytic subunit TRM6 n=3 Tax=Plasmodium knowlesi TaxID=5850 RepID=A0A5K1VFU7_PLAKH|nr:tRNA (adenine(58)-N(1))-methyltransferase non-catalytic subunit TRM6, putative [Plasmodium knowlesi strain H]OTN67389.1 putative Gcd10p-like protein [Plasmodium knowlesi]CAA9987397.1 tRNA (adenine(58)-N(1))-methyltransferase non-catalytic subunit TRM6, putative [Plasmodium knowlesi strain H]SBO23304.1 tRNA (adenine(58)-N(1))-methyltransferase non-catalytic subunit TRM6, putative [Plasmodium knowlesi strain H]SBO24338.1 tRNA (adenine(58)-N(1))-methyltransferase non-catalytic subunit TRM6, put|eukprot:XP_002258400.1 Gcd10p homolog, putative [Plasmodium knowlesi strain H]
MKILKHDFVLIDDELKCRLHKVVDMKIKIKKNYLNLMFLVNKKYGSTYTYINNKWIRCKKNKNKLDIDFYGNIEGTNKDIFQHNNSQKLTEENIAEMKDNISENPYEVIQKLVHNSSTYKNKTVISKFKYVEKKLKRHLCQFTVYECNVVNLINFYYKYFPEKISSVRVDYLSNLLFHLNRDILLGGQSPQGSEESTEKSIEGNNAEGIDVKEGMEKSIEGNNAEGIDVKEGMEKSIEETGKLEGNAISNHLGKESLHTLSSKKPNVIIYDDSFGLMISILNIIYSDHLNIFSLVYKNASNSIIPSFGIPKSTNVAKVSILHASHAPRLNTGQWLAIDRNGDLVGKDAVHEGPGVVSEELQMEGVAPMEEVSKDAQVVNVAEVAAAEEGQSHKRRINQVDHPCDGGQDYALNPPNTTSEPMSNSITNPVVDAVSPPNKRAKNAQTEADTTVAPDDHSQLQHMLIDHMNNTGAESFVVIISSDFIYNTNTDVHLLIETLIKVSLKFLKNDSKIIIHTDDLNICNIFLKGLMTTNSFINMKLNEFVLREQQVVKRRTHPVIKNAKLADGFLLTALKVEGGT